MKKYLFKTQAFTFLTILIMGMSCYGQVKKGLPKEKVSESKIITGTPPKLIKTHSLNKGDNVHCSLQDKSGNIWFEGRVNKGVFRYDGKSLTNLKPNGDN